MSDEDDFNPSRWSHEALLLALEEAQDQLDEYDTTLQLTAMKTEGNPYADPRVQGEKVKLHVKVMRLFRRLPRVELREKMGAYWDDAIIYRDEEGREIVGLRALDAFQGAVHPHTETISKRHQPTREVTKWDAELLPASAYRRSVILIQEILERVGYIEAPRSPKTVSVLDANGGEGNNEEVADAD